MKLKVCGMRDAQNIEELLAIQPDFIGFIFHEKSPRNISIFPSVNSNYEIRKVGVFVDESIEFILEKIERYKLDFVQLHGQESPSYCDLLTEKNVHIIKAFNINNTFNFSDLKKFSGKVSYFLFDAIGKNAGGNGVTFDWSLLDKYNLETPFFLSGGINISMIEEIKKINHLKLEGIDINSGFEIKPGLKNIQKIKEFKNEIFN